MKALEHGKPANKDERVFAFVRRYRELWPKIGKRYAKTYAISVFNKLRDLTPIEAAEKWCKEPQ